MKMLKRPGSSIDPWATLLATGLQLDFVLLMITLWVQPFRQLSIHFIIHCLCKISPSLYSFSNPITTHKSVFDGARGSSGNLGQCVVVPVLVVVPLVRLLSSCSNYQLSSCSLPVPAWSSVSSFFCSAVIFLPFFSIYHPSLVYFHRSTTKFTDWLIFDLHWDC